MDFGVNFALKCVNFMVRKGPLARLHIGTVKREMWITLPILFGSVMKLEMILLVDWNHCRLVIIGVE